MPVTTKLLHGWLRVTGVAGIHLKCQMSNVKNIYRRRRMSIINDNQCFNAFAT